MSEEVLSNQDFMFGSANLTTRIASSFFSFECADTDNLTNGE